MFYFKLYKTYFEPLHCLNFSVATDKTQNVLWRIENGELDGFSPKVNLIYLFIVQAIVIMIGVNNVLHTSEDIVDDILRIIELIKVKQPKASVIVMVGWIILMSVSYFYKYFNYF